MSSAKRKRPERLPKGLILDDIAKKSWKLGDPIGVGGFGDIYSAQSVSVSSNQYLYAIKTEPHTNGTLFVEINFYIRNAKTPDIADFKARKNLKFLGMPEYLGSGSHEYNSVKYRFLVMNMFGRDIMKMFIDNDNKMPEDTVFKIVIELLDVLEYIHSRGYIHGDIKPTNVLLDNDKNPKHVYLVDFGLCTKQSTTLKRDPKKAHNGTIEYLSRDAHNGVMSKRGDLEILGYNLIQLLGGKFPWEKCLTKPAEVQKQKEAFMGSLTVFLSKCFNTKTIPQALIDYLKYVANLQFDEKIDYTKLRKILISGVEKAGGSLKSALKFDKKTERRSRSTSRSRPSKSPKLPPKRKPPAATQKKKEVKEVKTNGTIKKKSKKVEEIAGSSNGEGDVMNGFTPEMIRLKNKMQKTNALSKNKKPVILARKSISPQNSRLRARKPINYSEKRSINTSVDIISDSE